MCFFVQMEPPVYSPKAHQCGLQISLLERLYDHDVYASEGPMRSCKTLLTENRRSDYNVLIRMFGIIFSTRHCVIPCTKESTLLLLVTRW